jgi:signal transduction histidine kinase
VTGFLSLALYDRKGEEVFDLIQKAQQSVSKAVEMSQLMLTYLGQKISNRKPLDLSETCGCCLPAIKQSMMKNISVESYFYPTGPIVNADEKQIKQLLINLVTNAKESIGTDGGSIKLNIKEVSVSEIPTEHRYPIDEQLQDQMYSSLEVIDSGHGISDNDIEKLFDPFFSTKFPGRGLGLPVVLGIVKAHQGVITVESNLMKGSAFRVFIPLFSNP